jgi:hypothetical protein
VALINELADRYVEEFGALHPVAATFYGIPGYDHLLPDLSPDGYAALADHDRSTLARLGATEPADERERVAKEAMVERLELNLERYDAGEVASDLNVISSELHHLRAVFDLMPMGSEPAATDIASRLEAVPRAVRQYRGTLLATSPPATRRWRSPSSVTSGPIRPGTTSGPGWCAGWSRPVRCPPR